MVDWPAARHFIVEPGARRYIAEIEPAARRDLLSVLTSSSEVRADVIRQFHERGKDDMAEVLIALEEKLVTDLADRPKRAYLEPMRVRTRGSNPGREPWTMRRGCGAKGDGRRCEAG